MNIPEAPAHLIAPKRKGDAWTWRLISCPHCGARHTHGAGDDGTDPGGHRSAHCSAGKEEGGYIIVRAK